MSVKQQAAKTTVPPRSDSVDVRARTESRPISAFLRTFVRRVALRPALARFGQPFHAVAPSFLPVWASLVFFIGGGYLILTLRVLEKEMPRTAFFIHWVWLIALAALIMTWIWEAFAEENKGHHTIEVQKGFRLGIILFILSEVMLFLSFFWGFFHLGLNPSMDLGLVYPPAGVVAFFWWRIPLLNTLILLSSGLSLTLAHKLLFLEDRNARFLWWQRFFLRVRGAVAAGKPNRNLHPQTSGLQIYKLYSFRETLFVPLYNVHELREHGIKSTQLNKLSVLSNWSLLEEGPSSTLWVTDTVIRGFIFLGFQSFEYITSLFTISDSVYGNVFFSLTGLHGFHVFIGALFLAVCVFVSLHQSLVNLQGYPTTRGFSFKFWSHRVGFDGAAWYWHFVDIVWLFVFVLVYWWGWDRSLYQVVNIGA